MGEGGVWTSDCGLQPPACPGRVVPHSPQNLAVALTSCPQLGQACPSLIPHSSQNFVPSGFSNLQFGQRMLLLYSFSYCLGKRNAFGPI